jgi:hypothetical protein
MNANILKPINFCFRVFKTFGLWQDGNQTWRYFILGNFFNFVYINNHIIWQLVYAVNAKNLIDFIDVLSLIVTNTSATFKIVQFITKIKNILATFESLKQLLKLTNHEKVSTQVNFAAKIYKILGFTGLSACFSGLFVAFFDHELPYKIWIPFNVADNFIGFWISSIYLLMNSILFCIIAIALDALPVIFISFAVGFVDELCEKLKEIEKSVEIREEEIQPESSKTVSKTKEKNSKHNLVKCIKIHIKVRKFVDEISRNFSAVIIFQGILSAIMLCTTAFTMSTVS